MKTPDKILGLEEVLKVLIEDGVPLSALENEYFKLVPEAKKFEGVVRCNIKKIVEKIVAEQVEIFFDDGTFVPKRLANKIKSCHFFKTTNGDETTYVYNGGVYKPNGASIIKEEAEKLLGERTKSHYVNETVFDIGVSTYFRGVEKKNLWLINMKNGIFDLENMELKPHDPDLFLITQIPVSHDPEVDCPKIKKFLTEVVAEEDIMILQELFGYCLWRDYHIQKAFMFVGDGANGKSTLIGLFKEFLGQENISSVSLQEIGFNRFALARLYGKLANLYPDLTDTALKQTGRFKMLTGGDPIEADRKFKDSFNFTNHSKLIYSANKVPATDDPSDAFFRRWVFVNFPNKFEGEKADKNILKKLLTEEELSGLFNWAIEGLKRLLENGEFSRSKSTEEIRDLYERMSSPIKAFVNDEAKIGHELWVTKDELYSAFIEYCKKNSLPTCANNIFARDLREVSGIIQPIRKKIENKQVQSWGGISLLTAEEKEKGGLKEWL